MKGIDSPPTARDTLLEQARRNGASDEVIQKLEGLREGQFDNVAQVMDASNE